MPDQPIQITKYDDTRHRTATIALWQQVFGYEAAHNEPGKVIDMKLAHDDGLFFVAQEDDKDGLVMGTVMAGYDGHRGWIYSIAVSPGRRKQGLGSKLLEHAVAELRKRGCEKVNLQIMGDNAAVKAFYEKNGFLVEERVSMGLVTC